MSNDSKVSFVNKKAGDDQKGIKFNNINGLDEIPESENENKIVVNERLKQFLFD